MQIQAGLDDLPTGDLSGLGQSVARHGTRIADINKVRSHRRSGKVATRVDGSD